MKRSIPLIMFLTLSIFLVLFSLFFGLWVRVGVAVFLFLLFLRGFFKVLQEERAVVEFLGRFWSVEAPGLHWIPFLMRVRAIIDIWEQPIELFKRERLIKIDFKNGSATPKGAVAFVQIDDPYKAIYGVSDWRIAIRDLLENALRSYLNSLTIEEGLQLGKAGYDFLERIPGHEKDGVIKAASNWGVKINRVVVADFDLDKTVIEARENVLKSERAQAAAAFEAIQKALRSGGMHGEIVKILEEYGYSKSKADKIAKEYVLYFQGTETGRIVDWRGGGDLESLLARLAVVLEVVKEFQKQKREQ
jgi:regulator of protease activity HflC (stomatin/prohibitin superfamily)